MGTARLRKVFRYPTESGNEPAEGIDEEGQLFSIKIVPSGINLYRFTILICFAYMIRRTRNSHFLIKTA